MKSSSFYYAAHNFGRLSLGFPHPSQNSKLRLRVPRDGHRPSSFTTRKAQLCGYANREKSADKTKPVKITLTSNGLVNQILYKSKRLRTVEALKSVFMSPDMSPDERARHKQLVMDLKLKISDQPERRHYIRQGQIVTVDKTQFYSMALRYILAVLDNVLGHSR